MKYCENCKVYVNDEKAVYCGICRSPMIDVDPNTLVFTADDYICPNCGYMYREDIGNCSFCGTDLVHIGEGDAVKAAKAIPDKQGENKKDRKKTVIGTFVAAAALALLIVGLFASGVFNKKPSPEVTTETDSTTVAPVTAETESESETENTTEAPSDGSVSLQKVGEIAGFISAHEGGLIYRGENNKYGVLSPDGKKDTGAIYDDADAVSRYFQIKVKRPADENDFDGINATGLIDGSGKELIPAEYAVIKRLNDRYWEVIKATEKTDSDDYLLYMTSGDLFETYRSAAEKGPRYKGEWAVFDVKTGKPIPGVSGTGEHALVEKGDAVSFKTNENAFVNVNEKGEQLPDGATVFGNGCYKIPQGNDYVICDPLGKEVFRCAADGFIPSHMTGDKGYYVARKQTDSKFTYVLMDLKGETVSFEFSDDPICTVWKSFMLIKGNLYDFGGRQIFTDSVNYNRMETFKVRNCGVLLKSLQNDYALLDAEGNVVWSGKNDDILLDASLTIPKKTDGGKLFLNWKDRDFTIANAISLKEGFVSAATENNTRALVDTVTGETLLSGYKSYDTGGNADDGLYVYAITADGAAEIYRMN